MHPVDSILARTTALGGLRLVDLWMPAGVGLSGHRHDRPHLCFVVDGGFTEALGDGPAELGREALRLSPAGSSHELRAGAGGARLLVVHVDDDEPGREALARLDDTRVRRGGPAAGWGLELAELLTARDETSPARLEQATRVLVAQAARAAGPRRPAPPPRWLRAALAELERGLPGAAPSAGELAASAGVHRVQLSRAFREHYGTSLSAHVLRRRVDRAWQLLRESPHPLGQVAYEAGFADQSHMTRALRAATGLTPGRIRQGAPSVQDEEGPSA